MKLGAAILLSGLLGAAACDTHPEDWNRTQKGALIGGASGAVLGGAVGSQSGNTATGAIIGGAAGAGAGGLIGHELDRDDDDDYYRRRGRYDSYDYRRY